MRWIDVSGPPGSGKSTLCDPLWHPHALPIENRLPPAQWHDFLNEVSRLFYLIRTHWSFGAAVRMNNRSIRKIATVARMSGDQVYIQTALVQRGLGFGWRLNELGKPLDELRHYFRLMPVSIGVAFTKCPQDVVIERNHLRETVKATAHENRDFMVPLMLPAIDLAKEVLLERGCPIIEIDTSGSPELGRQQLVDFAAQAPFDAEASGSGCQVEVLSPPPFWV
jgi:hypothetical protein